MQFPLHVHIALRYIRAKKKQHFVSFISLSSMIGIALGVMVLITVLAVMTGFDAAIQERVFSMAPQVTITTRDNLLPDWPQYAENMQQYKSVVKTAPYVMAQGMLTANQQVAPAIIFGVIPKLEAQISDLGKDLIAGSLKTLDVKPFSVILGVDLAEKLRVSIGDRVLLMTPTANLSPIGIVPRYKRFTVAGIFSAGSGFGFDSHYAYINLQDAQRLYQLGSQVSGLRLKLNDVYEAPVLSQKIRQDYTHTLRVSNWTDTYGPFFQAVAMEKTMMFLVLLLIIAIAVFNLVVGLVMLVTDKRKDIAILRTLGATPRFILSIFIAQGFIIALCGVLLGLLGGIYLALHVKEAIDFLEALFHVQLFSASVYYVNTLPSELTLADILKVTLSALSMGFLATLYPAFRAARMPIIEALHYE